MKDKISADLLSPTKQLTQPGNRIFALDFLKGISIAAVVFYHSIFVPISTYADAAIPELIISAPLRFCVPVMFTISFMLFEREFSKPHPKPDWLLLKQRLYRLAIPTAFWFSIAAALQLIKGNTPVELIGEILTGTIYIGAFYLIILLQFTPVYTLLRNWFINRRNIAIAILLQALFFIGVQAVIAGRIGIVGIDTVNILRMINRSFFIYWFVYMALGYYCYHHWSTLVKISIQIPNKIKIILVGLTGVLIAIEYSSLMTSLTGDNSTFEYAMLSCILSVFVVFACFASIEENQLPSQAVQIIQLLSKYSLGIFCINGILSQILSLIARHMFSEATFNLPEIILARLVGWIILLTASLGLSILLNRVRLGACVR